MEKLYGLPTGIGSLPHLEPLPALNLIFDYLPEVPHWPQLSASSEEEGLIKQYLSPLMERGLLQTATGRSPYFNTEGGEWLEKVTSFYEEVLAADGTVSVEKFSFPRESAAGFYAFLEKMLNDGKTKEKARFVKGQLTGAVSVGLQLTNERLQPSFYDDELRDVLVQSLALQARWQVRKLSSLGLPVLLFIDEPGLYAFGQSTYVGLSRQSIIDSLQVLVKAVKDEGALAGIHACAGIDWSLVFDLPFDVVNVDCYSYFTSLQVYTAKLDEFLKRGGILAWGLIPTDSEVEEDASSLLRLLSEKMGKLTAKGVDEGRLRRQLMFTPSCGTGTLSVEKAERIYSLLHSVSRKYDMGN